MTRLAAWLKQACMQLGVDLDVDYEVRLSDGVALQSVGRIRGMGGSNGMLVFDSYDSIRSYTQRIVEAGFGYTVLDEPAINESFELEVFEDMFADWGWRRKSGQEG
jgi:hypothetical protein